VQIRPADGARAHHDADLVGSTARRIHLTERERLTEAFEDLRPHVGEDGPDRPRTESTSAQTLGPATQTRLVASRPVAGTLQAMASEDELRAELERLKAENEALKSRRSGAVSMKVSEKGGLSVYGLGRFPVTLYQEQWIKLLDLSDDIRAFIKDHQAELKKRA
jgi:hypothetical protein